MAGSRKAGVGMNRRWQMKSTIVAVIPNLTKEEFWMAAGFPCDYGGNFQRAYLVPKALQALTEDGISPGQYTEVKCFPDHFTERFTVLFTAERLVETERTAI